MIRSLAARRALSLLLVLGFLGLGISGFLYLASQREPPEARQPRDKRLNVEVFQIGSEDIRQTLRGFGTVQPDREVILSTEVAGTIEQLHPDFEVGRSVLAPRYPADETSGQDRDAPLIEGDELVVIDQERYLGQVKQVASQIEEFKEEQKLAETELSNSRDVQKLATRDYELILADYKRKQELHKRGVLSDAELNRVELEVQQFQKNKTLADRDVMLAGQRLTLTRQKIETLQVQKELLQDDLERTVIRPPFDGYLSEVFVEVGQYVTPGEPIARITNIDRVEIPVSITLDDYRDLKILLGHDEMPQVELSLHEGERQQWTGEVVRAAPEANRETRTITVFVEVDNARQSVPLLPGTFVFARIEGPTYDSREHRIIPRDAMLGNRVYRVERGVAHEILLDDDEVIKRLQSIAVIKSDLKSGDLLVLTNLDQLYEGLPVNVGDRVHRLADELDSDVEWKNFWQIVSESQTTADGSFKSVPASAKSETAEVTN